MKLGTQVGLGPRHIVLDGNPAPPQKGTAPPIFGPCLLWPNCCMYQDTTWYGGRPQPRRHCVRWGPSSPSLKGAQTPIFGPCLYCGQTAMCIRIPFGMEVGLSLGDIVLDGDKAPPAKGGSAAPPPLFGPCLLWPRWPISATAELLFTYIYLLFYYKI